MIQASDARTAPIQLVVVARHRLDGDALSALFAAHADFRVVSAVTSIASAALVVRHRQPDAVLLDGALLGPHAAAGIEAALEQLRPSPILVLDDELSNGRLNSVRAAHHVGYFTRNSPFPELVAGLRRLVRGERAFDSAAGNRVHNAPHGRQFRREPESSDLALLTPREIQVLQLIAQGNTVKHCAELLALAPSTVDNHKSRLMKKLGVHKSLELTRLAIRAGLVSL